MFVDKYLSLSGVCVFLMHSYDFNLIFYQHTFSILCTFTFKLYYRILYTFLQRTFIYFVYIFKYNFYIIMDVKPIGGYSPVVTSFACFFIVHLCYILYYYILLNCIILYTLYCIVHFDCMHQA